MWMVALALAQPAAGSPWPDIAAALRCGGSAPPDAAVVIGNEDYARAPDVPYARADAEAFRSFLVYTRGVPLERVRLLEDATPRQMEKAVEEAAGEVGEGGTLWVYYAGHGAAHPSSGERMLLGAYASLDPDPELFEEGAVSLEALKTAARSGGGEALFVVDACYAGVGRSGEALGDGRFALPLRYAAGEVAEWTATQPDQIASPLEGAEHGAFTYFVVGALRGWADGELSGQPDGAVELDEARAFVERALKSAGSREQTPAVLGAFGASLSRGALEAAPDLAALTAGAGAGAAPEGLLSDQLRQLAEGSDARLQQLEQYMAKAEADWAQVEALADAGGAAGKQALELFIATYDQAYFDYNGQRTMLDVPQVAEAKARLAEWEKKAAPEPERSPWGG